MLSPEQHARPSALRLLEELPGIADVVWATVTRLASRALPTSVLFTAAEPRAGTTLLAAATAVGLAQHQRVPVCLLETGVRRPALASYLGLEGPGLSDILDGRAELEDCLQEPRDCPGLFVLHAGTPRAPVPGEFTTEGMDALLASLRARCRYLVLDAPPVLQHVEARLLLRQADAVLLVLRARVTRHSDAERTHDVLIESGTPVLGAIFNAYRPESLLGGNGRANRAFKKAVRGAPARARPEQPAPRAEAVPELRVAALSTNGVPAAHEDPARFELPTPPSPESEAGYRHQIELLERRIAKLTRQLEQTESDLRHIAAQKNVDLGIASIYRGVQGLSPEEEALASKKSLMQQIFQANLELKTAMAGHP